MLKNFFFFNFINYNNNMIINEYEKLSLKKFKIKNLKPDATILVL